MMLPGLIDNSVEFFSAEGSDRRLAGGSVAVVNRFPKLFSRLISEAIEGDSTAAKCLDKMGIYSKKERIRKYYQCNYSALDEQPDITEDKQLGAREYVSCPHRGVCPHEGKLCQLPLGLTKRERDVLGMIGLGYQDKQICAELFIAQDTLRNHKDNISKKAGIEGKVSLGILAHRLNIV